MTRKKNAELIYTEESYAIIGACFEAYKNKGCGFHEPIYHECLEVEFEFQRIPFLSKPPQSLQYRSRTLVRDRLQIGSASQLWSLSKTGIRPPPAQKP
jgi:hypothetical protein